MTPDIPNKANGRPGDTFLGIPIGELGWFACLLIGVASGFTAFFVATFLAIMALLVLNSTGHQLNYNLAYRRIGLPAGLIVGIVALGYLGTSWARRQITRR